MCCKLTICMLLIRSYYSIQSISLAFMILIFLSYFYFLLPSYMCFFFQDLVKTLSMNMHVYAHLIGLAPNVTQMGTSVPPNRAKMAAPVPTDSGNTPVNAHLDLQVTAGCAWIVEFTTTQSCLSIKIFIIFFMTCCETAQRAKLISREFITS